jgi:hypothetical protein
MIEVYPDYKHCKAFKDDGKIANCMVCDNKICPKRKTLNIPAIDPVNRPAHYTDGKIEVIDYIEDKGLGFCLGNAIKYISRAGKKYKDKEIEDLKKAIWYIERRIKELEEGLS